MPSPEPVPPPRECSKKKLCRRRKRNASHSHASRRSERSLRGNHWHERVKEVLEGVLAITSRNDGKGQGTHTYMRGWGSAAQETAWSSTREHAEHASTHASTHRSGLPAASRTPLWSRASSRGSPRDTSLLQQLGLTPRHAAPVRCAVPPARTPTVCRSSRRRARHAPWLCDARRAASAWHAWHVSHAACKATG